MQVLEKINTPDELLNRIQDRLLAALNPVLKSQILDGRLVEGVVLGATQVSVAHGLDRSGVKFIVVSPQADARVWQSASADSKFLYLTASAAVTVDLWVF